MEKAIKTLEELLAREAEKQAAYVAANPHAHPANVGWGDGYVAGISRTLEVLKRSF